MQCRVPLMHAANSVLSEVLVWVLLLIPGVCSVFRAHLGLTCGLTCGCDAEAFLKPIGPLI